MTEGLFISLACFWSGICYFIGMWAQRYLSSNDDPNNIADYLEDVAVKYEKMARSLKDKYFANEREDFGGIAEDSWKLSGRIRAHAQREE